MKKLLLVLATLLILPFSESGVWAAPGVAMILPPPNLEGGRPLMQVLNERRSARAFGKAELNDQQLAEILWAAVGVNRPDESNRRTVPTAKNSQNVEVYVLTPRGAFHYNAVKHELETLVEGDQTAPFKAPLTLIYTAPAKDDKYAGINVGHSSQNVYLYAASAGLNVVTRSYIDRPAIQKLLNLPKDRQIVTSQSVGPRP